MLPLTDKIRLQKRYKEIARKRYESNPIAENLLEYEKAKRELDKLTKGSNANR